MFKFGRKFKTKKKAGILDVTIILAITVLMMVFIPKEIKETVISKTNLNKQNKYQETVIVDGLTWDYTVDDGKATNVYVSSGLTDDTTAVIIPSSLDGYPVVSLGNYAFHECAGLTNIEIPSSVTSIGYGAFNGCTGLTEIIIPDSVTSIGDYAFNNCTGLTEIIIPDSVTSIGSFAFCDCTGITKITMPGTAEIRYYAFGNVTNVEEVILTGEGEIPDYSNRKYVDTPWYKSRENIRSITIGEGITSIGNDTFSYCTGLIEVEIPDSVTNIGDRAFRECIGLTEIEIPNNVTSIGDYAFLRCSDLKKITMSGTASIGQYAFYECNRLTIYTNNMYVSNYAQENNLYCILDQISPIIENDKNISSLTNENITITVTDMQTGLKVVTVNDREIELIDGIGTYSVIDDGTYEIIAVDNVGNIATSTFIVDKTNPNLTVSGNSTVWTKDDINLTIEAIDSLSGIANVTVNGAEVDLENGSGTYTATANGTYEVIATDNVGNAISQIIVVDKIDKTNPNLTVSGNSTVWTKDDINLTIEAIDSLSGIANVTVNGAEVDLENGSGTYTATANGTYEVIATDNVGNAISQIIVVDKIDKTNPNLTVSGNSTVWTKDDINLTIEAIDSLSGIANVTVNGAEVDLENGSGTYTATANGTYEVIATDNVGNAISQIIVVDKIDKTNPNLTVSGNSTVWTKDDINLTIEAIDSLSGIANVTVNGAEVDLENGSGTYTATANGTYEVIATDNVGNAISQIIVVDKIDKTNPNLTVSGNSTVWTKDDINLTIEAIDSLSGIANVTVNGAEVDLENGSGTYTATANGTYEVIVTDNAGNATSQIVVVDKIDKEAKPELYVVANIEEWTKSNVVLNITASSKFGLSSVKVNENSVQITNTNGIYEVTQNGTYTVVATDNAGNTTTKTIVVDKIDKVSPVINSITKNTEEKAEEIILTVNAIDGQSGIEGYSWDNGVTWVKTNIYTVIDNGTYKVEVKDKAGNISEKEIIINNIKGEEPSQEEDIIINNCEIKSIEGKSYVFGISSQTKINDFIMNIQTNTECEIVDKNKNIVQGNSLVATGMKIVTDKSEYILVVKADLNSDGKTDISDLSVAASYLVGRGSLDTVYRLAGDINSDGIIDITDISILATAVTRKLRL